MDAVRGPGKVGRAMKRRRPESRVPLWIVEGLDIAEQRRVVLLGVAVGLSAVGAVLSVFAPGIVPPRALVGAAVGVAALLLGYAAAVAVDAADLTVWGPRHVRAAGGEVVAIVPTEATLADARPLARAVLDAREDDERVLLGLAAAGREHQLVSAWSEVLATALAEEGVSVLFVDLAAGRSDGPGLYEVMEQGLRIGAVAEIDEQLLLARLGAGSDLAGALAAVRSLPERLPRDLDVLLLSLPTAASREVVEAAAAALDHVLVVAERGMTARVDLIAALDALEVTGTSAQAVLADDPTVSRMTGRSATGAGEPLGGFTASASPTAPDEGRVAAGARDEPESPAEPAEAPEGSGVDEVPAAPDLAAEEQHDPAAVVASPTDAEGAPADRIEADPGDPVPGPSASGERDAETEVPVEARAPEVLGAAGAALAAHRVEHQDLEHQDQHVETEADERAERDGSQDLQVTSSLPTPERARPPAQVPDLEPAPEVGPEEADTDEEDPLATTAQLAILVDEIEDRREQEGRGQG